MLSAMPLTIWSARKVTDASAWSAARPTPASSATTSATGRLPVLSAATMPKNAPTSMQPSSAMFVTPERSVITPPSAASAIGVASRSVAARTPAPMSTSRLTALPLPPRSCQCLRRGAAPRGDRPHDRLGSDHEQDDRLDDLDEVRGDARVGLHERPATLERGEEQRGERDADRRV